MMRLIKHLLARKISLLLPFVYTLGVTVLFLMPKLNISVPKWPIDKVVHFSIHLGLAFIWLLYLQPRIKVKPNSKKRIYSWVIVSCIIYGIVIELLQPILTMSRQRDIFDVLANSTGAILGTYVFVVLMKQLDNAKI